MGGKELKDGEYFDKLNFYNSIIKENGIDSNFYALDQRGAMVKASQYYNDDIYGKIYLLKKLLLLQINSFYRSNFSS
jgi:hypothetical protein